MSKNVQQDKNGTLEEARENKSETAGDIQQEDILNSDDPIIDVNDETVKAPNETKQNNNSGISGEIFGKIAELEQQIVEYKEQSLRFQAEMANTKRRADLSVEKAHKFGVEKLAKELIPVIDSLEKAIESAEKIDESQNNGFIEGIDLVLKQFLGALEKFSIKQIDPNGEPFDPHYHQAVAIVDKPEAEPNTVVEVCQKGCRIHDRILRPAMVIVSSK